MSEGPQHRVELDSGFLSGNWTAVCTCGWVSEPFHRPADALAASEMHQAADITDSVDGPNYVEGGE